MKQKVEKNSTGNLSVRAVSGGIRIWYNWVRDSSVASAYNFVAIESLLNRRLLKAYSVVAVCIQYYEYLVER